MMINFTVPIWVVFITGGLVGAGLTALIMAYRERGKTIRKIQRIVETSSKKVKK